MIYRRRAVAVVVVVVARIYHEKCIILSLFRISSLYILFVSSASTDKMHSTYILIIFIINNVTTFVLVYQKSYSLYI